VSFGSELLADDGELEARPLAGGLGGGLLESDPLARGRVL
jgi:hypothetical protein